MSYHDLPPHDAAEPLKNHLLNTYGKPKRLGALFSFILVGGATLWDGPTVSAGVLLDGPWFVAQTAQSRSDRVVGRWRSSSGPDITLAYSGNPATLWIQVFLKPGKIRPREDFTASWIDQGRFTYKASDGSIMIGTVDASGRIIRLKSNSGWSATWTRLP